MGHAANDHGAHAGHGHGSGSHHSGSHHSGSHGAPEPGAHGPAELPPAPLERSISPAPEDFENLPGPRALVWPVLWIGLGALLTAALLSGGWPAFHGH